MTDHIRIYPGKPKKEKLAYSDVEFVEGLLYDRKIQFALYRHWESYFNSHCGAEFYMVKDLKKEIIHNAYTVLWNKVRCKRIYVEEGVLKGAGGEPFKSSLTTYLMSVAKRNNLELVRDIKKMPNIDDLGSHRQNNGDGDEGGGLLNKVPSEPIEPNPFTDPSAESAMRDIVAEIVSNMSERCKQILTMFYYKEMKLDRIMEELPSFTSKDALKSKKNKCMNRLKEAANARYKEYLNN